jgi:hypothetical protein
MGGTREIPHSCHRKKGEALFSVAHHFSDVRCTFSLVFILMSVMHLCLEVCCMSFVAFLFHDVAKTWRIVCEFEPITPLGSFM